MIRKRATALIICGLLLGSCNSNLAEKENRCSEYASDIDDRIKFEVETVYPTSDSSDHWWFMFRKELFYSNKIDTCVYVVKKELYDGPVLVLQDYIVRDYYKEADLKSFTIVEQRLSTGNLGDFEDYILKLRK